VFADETFRAPRSPGRNESFTVDLRVFRGDITGAKVRAWDGSEHKFDMFWVRNEGPYDIWRANVTGTASNALYYRFEITDGTDTDYYNRLGMTGGEPASGDFLVNTTPLGRFPLGATVDSTGVVFRVWAPNATTANVAGQFNNWSTTSHPMTNIAGVWQTRITTARLGQEYQFVFQNSGTHWRTDPRSRIQVNSVGNSVIGSGHYPWTDHWWQPPAFQDMVLYEMHVGTFSGEGDGVTHHPGRFRDVVDAHLDHLVELGVNTIELMPITEFAGDLSWGYNPAFQFAPESAYGSPDDLKYLVNRCHQAGLAVLVDVVFNHMGASDLSGNLLNYDGEEIYFYPTGSPYRESPWGPRPDYGRREVREYISDAIRSWIEEYHMDGFRLDGTDFIKVNGDGWHVLQDIARTVDTTSARSIVIAEQLPNDNAVTQSIDDGGAGADAQWNDAFHDSLRAGLVSAAFGDPNMGALVNGMNHFGFGGARAVNYIESHDEVAVQGRAVKAADSANPHSIWAYGRGKVAYGLTMFTAGLPMILQGQEFMEDRAFGDTTGNRIQWAYKETYADYARACRDMTWLRRRSPALRGGASQNIFHVNEQNNIVAWHRWNQSGDDLVIIASLANNAFDSYCVGMPQGGVWLELFNSDAAAYGGENRGNSGQITANGAGRDGLPASACIILPRMGLLVFGRQPVNLIPVDADLDGIPDSWEEILGLNPNDSADALEDFDGDGVRNLDEFRASTDIRSASSVLRLTSVHRRANTVEMEWQTVPGRTYQVQAASGLPGAPWGIQRTIQAEGDRLSHTNSLSGQTRFFRVQVQP
jgi:1,4-alpha-glucan branching enzyme